MSDVNIPFDIQIEIIKRVSDVKSLLRFRSVSNPWKAFIDGSKFITAYCTRDTQSHRLLLRYKDNVDLSEVKYFSFVDDVSFPQQQLDFAPNVPDLVKQLKNSKVIGSACGLWCLHGYNSSETEMLVIWNPSIRKSVAIVVPCEHDNTSGKLVHIGFGVSPSTYDPTIVLLSYSGLVGGEVDKWQVEVLTLTSKTWKTTPNRLNGTIRLRQGTTQVATHRFIFWAALGMFVNDGDNGLELVFMNFILSFDLITHEFNMEGLPVSIANQVSDNDEVPLDFFISKLNESLVLSAYTNEVNDGRVYGVWMMGDEGGVMTSFTKLFNINAPHSHIRTLLGFRKSGQSIMETGNDGEEFAALEAYEPCSQRINNLGIYGEKDSLFICPYKESLLLADHSDGCIISNDYFGWLYY